MLYHTSAKPLSQRGKASFAAQETFSRGVIKSICLTVSPLRKARIFAFFSVTRSPSRLRTILAGKCLTLRIFLVDHTLTYARYCPLLYATSSGQPRRPTPHQPRHTAAPQSSCTRHTAHKRPRPYKKEVKGRCGIIFLQKNLVV